MQLYARQGDLVFKKLSEPIVGTLKPVTGLVLAGNDSAPHTVAGLVNHRQDGRRHFIEVPTATVSQHAGRHVAVALEAGSYEITPLRERGDGADRAVED